MSTDLATMQRGGNLPSVETSRQIVDALEILTAVRTFVKAQFVPGTDAGTIPGCGDKPTLLLPGAQKATMYFNAYPTFTVKKRYIGNDGHIAIDVRAVLISRSTKEQIGEGVGCCSTMEKKYRYRPAERTCPSCGKATIIKGKEEYGGGFLCFAKKGGCGAKFGENAKAITSQPVGQVENPDIYDLHNTVLKIAKKRAHVDAAMTLGCLSELFTQDIEDTYQMDDIRVSARPIGDEAIDVEVESRSDPGPRASRGNPHPNNSGHGHGIYASPDQTAQYRAWLESRIDKANDRWVEFWTDPNTGEIRWDKELINIFKADGHLVKWAANTGRLDPSVVEQDRHEQTRKLCQLAAVVYHRSEEDRKALSSELNTYFLATKNQTLEAIYRKHPELAPPPEPDPVIDVEAEDLPPAKDYSEADPEGDFPTRDETQLAGKGDAYEGPDEPAAAPAKKPARSRA